MDTCAAIRDQWPVFGVCRMKSANHKDYNGNIKPPLEKAIATIKGDGK